MNGKSPTDAPVELFCNLLLRGLLDYAEGDTSKDVAKETVTQLSPEIG